MLKFNFKPMFAARGIDRPVGFLRKLGVSPYTSSYIARNKITSLRLEPLEQMCLWLNCTPHDFLEWEPDAKIAEPSKYELSKLIRAKKVVILSEELRGLSLEKLERIHRFIEETKKEG